MYYDDMKESLRQLAVHLEAHDTLGDPKNNLLFVSSQSSAAAQLRHATPLIENFQHSILDLSRSLDNKIRQYSNLVTSLISSINRTTPSLPNETMVEIFQNLIADGSHHLHPLLLVNKRFHALATSAPTLWCNINIKFDRTLQEHNNLSVQYIRSCIKHSQSSLLNVGLDIADIPYPEYCAKSILEVVKKEVPRFGDVIDLAIDIIDRVDWVDDDDAFFARRLDKLEAMAHVLAGNQGVHMCRWRSFRLSSPEDDPFILGKIWPFYSDSMPRLETFVFKNSVSVDLFGFDLSNVRHLTLHHTEQFHWAFFSRHLLTTAVVGCCSPPSDLRIFSGCGALQELTIVDAEQFWVSGPQATMAVDVELPSLRKLTLGGRVGTLKFVTFKSPCLESLTLLCGREDGIPKVRARLVEWIPDGVENLESTVEFLRYLFGEVREMEELVFRCEEAEMVSIAGRAVREMIAQQDSSLVDTSLVIRIVSGGLMVDVIQIGNN